MGARDFEGQLLSGADGTVRHQADVLVIGGGPAGWRCSTRSRSSCSPRTS
jgi:hypothetical protein